MHTIGGTLIIAGFLIVATGFGIDALMGFRMKEKKVDIAIAVSLVLTGMGFFTVVIAALRSVST